MKMTRDELEYAISQYVDGTLAPIERPVVEERLATDPEARALLEEYRRFNTVLKTSIAIPQIAWDKLQAQISSAVAGEEAPVRHFSIRSVGVVRSLALAAVLLLVVSVTVRLVNREQPVVQPPSRVVVEIMPSAEPRVAVVENVQIGPSAVYAGSNRAAEEIVSRPTIVLIDRAASSGQDSDAGFQ
jgi:anti-sigma factor RsiW